MSLRASILSMLLVSFFTLPKFAFPATITINSNINWSSIVTGSGPGGQPDATDDIDMGTTGDAILTIDVANAVCNDFIFGSGANKDATLQFSTAGNKLTVLGDFQVNTGDKNKSFDINVGAGYFHIDGTFSYWGGGAATPKCEFTVTTGTVVIDPAVAFDAGYKKIDLQDNGVVVFNGLVTQSDGELINTGTAGSYYFNAGLTRTAGTFTTLASENIYFGGNLTASGTALTFDPDCNTIFSSGSPTITPTAAITFGNFQINSGVTVTLAGAIQVEGNWINNGGTLTSGGNLVTLNGNGKVIGGSGTTAFGPLLIGTSGGGTDVDYSLASSITCTQLTFSAAGNNRSLTHSVSTASLTVSGNVTMNQPTSNGITNSWNVNSGYADISGNFSFSGTNNSATRIGEVQITSGSFTLDGTLSWMTNTAIASEVISVTTGDITFNSSITMGSGSGTIGATSGGTIDFNGAAAPSLAFGGGTSPVFNSSATCTIKFKNGFTNSNNALILADRSITRITGSGTITPNAAITFGEIIIESGNTMTLAGNISLTNDFTNSGGTLAGNYRVTMSGTADQTITSSSGTFTFYNFTSNCTGPIVFATGTDVVVTNDLNLTAGLYNLNNQTLTLGSSGNVSTLNRTVSGTTNWFYDGTFKRFWPNSISITSNSGNYYGLFPMGYSTASSYRPVELNTTVGITTGGDFSVYHTENYLTTALSPLYNDGGTNIERISNAPFQMAINGVVGGTFDLDVTMTDLSAGTLSDLRLAISTGGTTASAVGTHAAATGTAPNPTVSRTGISTLTDFNNDFRVATSDAAATPIRDVYYSIATNNWNTLGTWAVTSGGASCGCLPSTSGYVVIENGYTVTVDAPVTVDFIDIRNTSTMNSAFNVTTNKHVFTSGSGKFTHTAGTFTVSGNFESTGTGANSSSDLVVGGNADIGVGTTLTINSSASLDGDLTVDGMLSIGITTVTLSKAGARIDGTGSITGTGIILITSNKTVKLTANLTVAPVIAISGANVVTSQGTITLTNDMLGTVGGSTWTNAAASRLNITGELLSTGTLNASAAVNVVNYNGAGAQTVKTPSTTYHRLEISNSGTKSMASDFSVNDLVTIQDAAILDAVTYVLDGGGGLTMTGTSELKIQKNANATFPQLTGAYNLTAGTITLEQTANTPVLRGVSYYNLTLGGSRNFDASSLTTVNNNLIVQGSAKFNSNAVLTVGNAFAYNSSNSTTLANNMTVGSFSISAGTLNDGGYSIEVNSGDWTKDGGTFTTSGTTEFSGTSAQTIGGTQSTTFYNLTLNNTDATNPQITIGNNITVNNNLNMTTQASEWTVDQGGNTITIGQSAGSPGSLVHDGTENSGYFYGGSFIRYFGTATFPAFTHSKALFPLGTSREDYRPFWVNVSTALSSGGSITLMHNEDYNFPMTIAATHNDPSWGGGTVLEGVSNDDWTVSTSGIAAAGTNFDIAFGGTGFGSPTLTDLNASLTTTVVGTFAATTNTYTGFEVNRTGLTLAELNGGGSQIFRVGTKDESNSPLPIELLKFEAALNDNNTVDLIWVTSSEVNNDRFEVERSANGIYYEKVATVDGAGNSNERLEYYLEDQDPLFGTSYYRLKQVDFNGAYSYSDIRSVTIDPKRDFDFDVYPNPSDGTILNLSFSNPFNEAVNIEVSSISGASIFQSRLMLNEATSRLSLLNEGIGELANGLYYIRISTDINTWVKRFVIE